MFPQASDCSLPVNMTTLGILSFGNMISGLRKDLGRLR